VNPDADDTANFADDIYYIDRKSHEDRDMVEFELASSVDLAGVQLPRRQVIQNICTWQYRGAECGFTGAPVFDANDDVLLTTSSSEGLAVIAAYNAVQAAIADLALKETALSLASSAKGAACEMKLVETRYDVNNKVVQSYLATMAYDTTTAVFGGVPVSLGSTYRQGASKDSGRINYAIEYWAIDTAGCTTATTAYNSALTARNTAQTTLDSANTTLTTALAALPVDDPLYTQDKCGKRLTSCKNRFGATEELPFGAFPAAGLAK
jgi:phage-related protein